MAGDFSPGAGAIGGLFGIGDTGGTGHGFMSLFGPEGMGLTGSTGRANQRTAYDPTTLALNNWRLAQLQGGSDAIGGFGGGLNHLQSYANIGSGAQSMIQQIMQSAQQEGLDPEAWYARARADLDPSASIGAAQGILKDIVQPELQGQYGLMGMGRSGAAEEALGKAGEQIALPIAQQQQQNLFSLNQQYPNVDVMLRGAGLQRLGQGLQAADYERQAGADIWTRILHSFMGALSTSPYNAMSDITSNQVGNAGLISSVFGGGGSGGQAISGLAAAGLLSDRRAKHSIVDFDANEFLDAINAYSFSYNGESLRRAGVMAQELESTAIGSSLVKETPQGKVLNVPQLVGTLMACVVSLHKRVKELEHGNTAT